MNLSLTNKIDKEKLFYQNRNTLHSFLLWKNEKRCVFAEEAWQRKPVMLAFKETHK